jgi:NAD(P) transhydrogenase subunit beta
LDNRLLIVAGALDGSSGFLLSVIMCRAMHRSFTNVLFGGFGARTAPVVGEGRPFRAVSPEETAMILDAAQLVIVVPGYGMAAAQAQHAVQELATLLVGRGVDVRFAIHPVAGRMPGHMNVLLAEANVPYERLFDLDDINPEFPRADVALVVGANDVVNPAARTDPASPVYGMPILDADAAHAVIVVKRSMGTGFAGVDNDLFYLDKTQMLFGDAKQVLRRVVEEVERLPVRSAA